MTNLPVTRIEFQLRRPTLLQFQGKINTLDDLEDHLIQSGHIAPKTGQE